MNSKAYFADLLSKPGTLAFVSEAYGRKPDVATISVTSVAHVEGSHLMTPPPVATGTRVVGGKKRAKKEETAPISASAAPKAEHVPTMTADQFLDALRVAGKRPATYEVDWTCGETGECFLKGDIRLNSKGEPILVHDPRIQVADETAAIDAFVGYERGEAHGTQLDRSRLLAQNVQRREVRHAAGIPLNAAAYRSSDAHADKWAAEGSVKGLPDTHHKLLLDLAARERLATADVVLFGKLVALAQQSQASLPILPTFDGELTEEQFNDAKEAHVEACAKVKRDRVKALADFEGTIAREFPNERGVEPVYGSATDPTERTGYKVIETLHPIVSALADFFTVEQVTVGRVTRLLRNWRVNADMLACLGRLEALAAARLFDVQQNIDAIDSNNPTAEQVDRAYAAMEGMMRAGREVSLTEAVINVYSPASRSYASLPIGTVVPVGAVERIAKSDDHGILNTTPKG